MGLTYGQGSLSHEEDGLTISPDKVRGETKKTLLVPQERRKPTVRAERHRVTH